jgi:aerobic carbon-monoxide dehydrogenase large subunit
MIPEHSAVGDRSRYARGRGRYVVDVSLPGQAALHVLRSYLPHATLGRIGTDEARGMPGVLGVWTALDIIADLGRLPVIHPRFSDGPAIAPYLQSVLAHDRVRYVGEPVAIIAAETRHQAEDAAEMVSVDLEELNPVTDLTAAVNATALFQPGNVITTTVSEFGDPDDAFASAPVVVERTICTNRHSGIPMETRGVVVDPVSDRRLTVWGAAKVPHTNRAFLAQMLGIPQESIRMLETDVGAGFGIRGEFYPEDFLTAWAAVQLGRPVGWTEDRWEHMVAANQSRGQFHHAAVCATEEGELLGLRTEFWMDAGAYVRTAGTRVADLTLGELPGPYRFPGYRGQVHCVVTNRTPTGTYRSPGRFESSFVRERLLDALADQLRMDGRELRRRNLIRPSHMPYRSGLQSAGKAVVLSEGDYPKLFHEVCEATARVEADVRGSYASNPERLVGSGVGAFIERSGLGPFEEASVEVSGDGAIAVRTGATFFGQGLNRALARVVADQLGVDVSTVRVMKVDTDRTERGVGTYASRGLVMAGSATLAACRDLLGKARHAASVVLETAPETLVYQAARFRCARPHSGSVTLADIARRTRDARLVGEGRHEAEHVSFGFGAHGAVCSVDPSTGLVRVDAMILGYDAGRVIDPEVVEGQLQGAATQAIGGALLECFSYDSSGNPLSTTFMDYLLPTASEAPEFTIILGNSITAGNPLGARGAGEAGIPGVAAAIARAIESACGASATLLTTPICPDTVWHLCRIQ